MTDWNLQRLLRMLRLARDDVRRAEQRRVAKNRDRAAASQRAVNARRAKAARKAAKK